MRNSLFSWNWRRAVGQEERSHRLEYSQDTKGRPLKPEGKNPKPLKLEGKNPKSLRASLNAVRSHRYAQFLLSPCPMATPQPKRRKWGLLNLCGTWSTLPRLLQDSICASPLRGDSTEVWGSLGLQHKQGLFHESFPKISIWMYPEGAHNFSLAVATYKSPIHLILEGRCLWVQ